MAQNDKDKPQLNVKSTAQLEMERLTGEGYTDASAINTTATLNPDPFGKGAYVGTDPIYQNSATDNEKPLASKSGAEAELEKFNKGLYDVEDSSLLVDDPGMGGKARLAVSPTVVPTRVLLPGQEGYEEPRTGQPVRADDAEKLKEEREAAEKAAAEEAQASLDADGEQNQSPASPAPATPPPAK